VQDNDGKKGLDQHAKHVTILSNHAEDKFLTFGLFCRHGETPFIYAIMAGRIAFVKYMLENGADTYVKGYRGNGAERYVADSWLIHNVLYLDTPLSSIVAEANLDEITTILKGSYFDTTKNL